MPTPMCRRAALFGIAVCAVMASGRPAGADPLVTIETTGEEVVGRLATFDSRKDVRLSENGGSGPAIRDVLKITFEGAPKPPTTAALGEIELIDSSRFEYVGVTFDDETVQFELRGGVRLETPFTGIAWWRVGKVETLDMADTSGASDVLVVKRRDGGYAPVKGVVVELNSEGVRFGLEADEGAEPVEAPWDRIGGIRFYRADAQEGGECPVIVALVDGGHVAATEVAYASGRVRWPRGEAPIEAVASMDLTSGRVAAAGELKLVREEFVPYFPDEAKKTHGYAFGRSLFGGPLALRYPDHRAPDEWPAVAVKREFARGVAVRSRTELSFELPAGAKRLRGVVGLDPEAIHVGSADVKIVAGDKTLWSGVVDGESAPATIDTPLGAAKTLTLHVDYGDNLDAGDFVNFCDLRVIR